MEKRTGLSSKEVEIARQRYGSNTFTEQRQRGFFVEFLHGFTDPMILILLAALAVNLLFVSGGTDLLESLGIASAVLVSVTVSTLSEYRSARAFARLRAESAQERCRVIRDGAQRTIPSEEVVQGDLVLLSPGEMICADGELLEGVLSVNQSAINGESREAKKFPARHRARPEDGGALFSGTLVCDGEGVMRVLAVGDATLYGTLAAKLQESGRKSPLKEKLGRLAKTIALIGYCAAALIALCDIGYEILLCGAGNLRVGAAALLADPVLLTKVLLHALTLAVTVIVVAVPEGLPMMITVVLSSQTRKMLREGVLVRRLNGIETAGCTDLLFCDKTGTLTEGVHGVQEILAFQNGRLFEKRPTHEELKRHFLLNNQARLQKDKVTGSNATDRALLSFLCSSVKGKGPRFQATDDVVRRIGFDSAAKFSAVELSDGSILIKGAPERLIRLATHLKADGVLRALTEKDRENLLCETVAREREGARVLAFAEGRGTLGKTLPETFALSFFVCLSDTLRPETREVVKTLQTAGVQVVMLTGDAEETALSVARKAAILSEEGVHLTSHALSRMSDEKLARVLPRLRVVSRCTPSDKSRLAALATSLGRVTAMTGDGVNDAPALKISDVGFAMGSGTQIAKDAADVVLTDDRLHSLSQAVLYGRTVFRSIQKFITFQLTMNFCALFVSLVGPLLGIEAPITVLQMLWVNLIMDTLASLAFSGEAPRKSYLLCPPIRRDEPILSLPILKQISFGTLVSVTGACLFLSSDTLRALYGFASDPTAFLTAFFLFFVFCGAFNLFNVRTPRLRLWAELLKNPAFLAVFFLIASVQTALSFYGGALFRCAPLPTPLFTLPLSLALCIIPLDLVRKMLTKKGLDS